MLIYNETPMEVHVTSTWIPNEFILINAITMNMIWIHNDRVLKESPPFPLILHMFWRLADVKNHLPHSLGGTFVGKCKKYSIGLLKTCLKHYQKYLLVVAQVFASLPITRCAEFNEFLDLHLRTAYRTTGWTLYPLLTQAYNHSPIKKLVETPNPEHFHIQAEHAMCIKENWLMSPSKISPFVSWNEPLGFAGFVKKHS